jgi:hypothetical protein
MPAASRAKPTAMGSLAPAGVVTTTRTGCDHTTSKSVNCLGTGKSANSLGTWKLIWFGET